MVVASASRGTNATASAFLLAALQGAEEEQQRLDGRRPFDARRLTISFSREDGVAEVQLGQTHIMCVVSCVLVQPYPDRHNEGILAVYTEFSPMADPTFEAGQLAEGAVELGQIIDRGLRESRAIDTESLCVLAGKAVWSLRIDICILNNGGNLVDAANVAALAALLSFRRPECTIGGPGGQDIIVHPPEVREPVPLIIHFLPVSVTFGLLGDGEFVVMDPTYQEELLMKGRLTVSLNAQGDICSIQKGGGSGMLSTDIMRCLRIASTKVANVTIALKKAVEAHELERAQRKIIRHRDTFWMEELEVEQNAYVEEEHNVEYIINGSTSGSSDEYSTDEDHSAHRFPKLDKSVKQDHLNSLILGKPLIQDAMKASAKNRRADTEPVIKSSKESLIGVARNVIDVSVLEVETNLVSQKIEKIGIDVIKEEEVFKGIIDATAVKKKPVSLLDAVKRNNLKKNRIYSQKA